MPPSGAPEVFHRVTRGLEIFRKRAICGFGEAWRAAGAKLSDVSELDLADPITVTCLAAGKFTLSAGTMEPAIVIERLLVALSVLSLSAYRRLLAPDGPLAKAPTTALRDGSSSWWCSHEATLFMQAVIGAINDAAPAGYVCSYSEFDRIELVRLDTEVVYGRQFSVRVSSIPAVSAVRARAS
jgi:hypothetical protein